MTNKQNPDNQKEITTIEELRKWAIEGNHAMLHRLIAAHDYGLLTEREFFFRVIMAQAEAMKEQNAQIVNLIGRTPLPLIIQPSLPGDTGP